MTALLEAGQLTKLFTLTDREYALIRDLVFSRFGISLGEQKRSLIIGRLQKVLRENGFTSFADYYDYVIGDPSGHALEILINRLSTNHTFFYREKDHFEFFSEQVLPRLVEKQTRGNPKTLRIWCPGCSSGEEPYTLAMLISEFFGCSLPSWDIGILATDISTRVLDRARAGIYSNESISRLPPLLIQKYFNPRSGGERALDDRIKKMVLFRRLNLMRREYPFKNNFQAIFCRNVMIYFDQPTRVDLARHLHRHLESEGFLFIGHSESLGRNNDHFRYVRPAVYQKVDAP